MAQKTVYVPEIGELVLSKRRGATHMRLSINAAGKVRVGMPYWTPYQAGIMFAKSKADWINKHLGSHGSELLKDGDLIGKSHRLNYVYCPTQKTTSIRVGKNLITVTSSAPLSNSSVQKKTISACERALKLQAEHLLPQRLKSLAQQYDFDYHGVQIRKLIARWGSCSSKKVITLSYYLIQLPWPLIDYVLVHELIHTRHMHHGKAFWDDFKKIMPNAKAMQKEIRTYKPLVKAYKIIPGK
jgi:predicted metal-dependent hydrolase